MVNYKRPGLVFLHIIAWPSTIATIPTGWQICDGTNGTPDLRSRFVRGPPASTENGGTGGSDTVTLDQTMIPSHSHGITDPQHSHGITVSHNDGTVGGASGLQNTTINTNPTTPTITINNIGGGGSHENRPAFYQVVFICKMVTT